MNKIKTAHIISHTHWDREWYLNSPFTNPWLVPFFETLFRMLDKEPEYRFVLDGQTAIIEDWCEQLDLHGVDAKPWLEKLSGYIRQGRLLVGPYYLQPDWQLVSEESLVRNLLIGKQIAERLGRRMQAGWLLDNFGQISQTVQIHRQFGLDGLFVWRGVEMDPSKIRSEFTWEAPDGSRVLAVYLVGSYRNGMRLAEYAQTMAGRIQREIAKLSPFATSPNILLMNGYDQEMQPDDILPLLRKGGNLVEGVNVRQSTPEEYLEAIREGENSGRTVLRGALYSGRYISVFPGILSSRMYLKQQNEINQNLIQKYAEPLATLLWVMGQEYPADKLLAAWKILLKNQPHDSICGVSIDDVASDMEARFQQSQAIASQCAGEALACLAGSLAPAHQPGVLKRWLVVNTALKPACGLVQVADDLPENVRFTNGLGEPLASQVNPDGLRLLALANVPAAGWETINAIPGDGPESQDAVDAPVLVNLQERTIENTAIKVQVAQDGSYTIVDKVNQVAYPNLGVYEDGGDAGDSYNYSYPPEDVIVTSRGNPAEITFLETGPLRARVMIQHRLALPVALTPDRRTRSEGKCWLPVTCWLTVEAGSAVVGLHIELSNPTRDHRLRLLFPSGIETGISQAETQFDVVTRKICPERYDDSSIPEHVRQVIIGAREPEPVTIFPQRGFVDLNDGRRGMAVLNYGLPEYEILTEKNTIALTLFRSVGWIARPDLITRIGDAGPLIAVPGAQCLRTMAFDCAVMVHQGDWQRGRVLEEVERFTRCLLVTEAVDQGGNLPARAEIIRLDDPEGGLKVTALKLAEDRKALIVRFHNPSEHPIEGRILTYFEVERAEYATLAEIPVDSIHLIDDHTIPVRVMPKAIVTIRLAITPFSAVLNPVTNGQIRFEMTSPGGFPFPMVNQHEVVDDEEILREEERALELEHLLADMEARLKAHQGEKTSDEKSLIKLRLDAASLRRTALEARLSALLLRKNSYKISQADAQILDQVDAEIRRIGDAINTARIEKRGLEYVFDYYSR
ncbi:MAG TPA: glycoside hydrolase family 38 C-terminal domain-containing protein [Anaerolineaceae bacterium]